jgi:hypothetical protein
MAVMMLERRAPREIVADFATLCVSRSLSDKSRFLGTSIALRPVIHGIASGLTEATPYSPKAEHLHIAGLPAPSSARVENWMRPLNSFLTTIE